MQVNLNFWGFLQVVQSMGNVDLSNILESWMLLYVMDESKHFLVWKTLHGVWFWAQRVGLKSFLHRRSWKFNEFQGTFKARPKAAYIVRAILQIRSAASACPEPKPLGSERQTSTDAVAWQHKAVMIVKSRHEVTAWSHGMTWTHTAGSRLQALATSEFLRVTDVTDVT